MFRITDDPSSGSLAQCLSKNYKTDSIVSVDMDKVGVMAAYSDPLCLCVCVVHCIWSAFVYSEPHTHTHWVTTCCHNTDLVHVNGDYRITLVILDKHWARLPDDGSSVIRNMLEHF